MEDAVADKSDAQKYFAAALRWFAQPTLPRDPLNNPLSDAPFPFRVAGALRVYARGLFQVIFPWQLSGDYSSPQEPVPSRLIFPESVIGAAAMVLPLPLAFYYGLRGIAGNKRALADYGRRVERAYRAGEDLRMIALRLDKRPVFAIAVLWIVVSYFPVSNIPVVLPTVRAERFWYFPAMGTSVILALAFRGILRDAKNTYLFKRASIGFVTAFLIFQCAAARRHANDYKDDLTFWDATRKAVPNSAKAHLNYSVMKGARGDLEARLHANEIALQLSPNWPMANVYLGDTLCRLHRSKEAWPHYKQGFELGPNEQSLIGLGLQCLWDEKFFNGETPVRQELEKLGDEHKGSWLDYLAKDLLYHGEEHGGVDPKYRPRGYNEGPKE
jgi:hypothetical protein